MSHASDLISASPGMIFDHAGFDCPAGFEWADGAAVSRATFTRLFAAITRTVTGTTTNGSATITGVSADLTAIVRQGMPLSGPGIQAGATVSSVTSNTIVMSAAAGAGAGTGSVVIAPWGVGDGVTTFNKPDYRGRSGVGRDDMGGTAANRMTTGGGGVQGVRVGASGGTETHTLTTAQMPAHNHSVIDPGHIHTANVRMGASTTGGTYPYAGSNDNSTFLNNTASATTGISIQNNGGGGAHPNVHPVAVCNKIVKT